MRTFLAVVGDLALAGCNPVSKSSQAAYAAEISVEGQKALGEAMKLMELGHPSMAIEKLAAWDSKAADAIKKIKGPDTQPDRQEGVAAKKRSTCERTCRRSSGRLPPAIPTSANH